MTEWRRRDHHRVLGLLAAGCVALLLAAAPVAQLRAHRGIEQDDSPSPSTADIVRFLEQATFGPTAELIAHVQEVGFEQYLTSNSTRRRRAIRRCRSIPTTRDTATCPSGSACQRDNYTIYPVQNRFS